MTATRDDLFARFDALGIAVKTVDHPAVFTVEESHAIHKHELLPGGHTKICFLRTRKGRSFLCRTIPEESDSK